MPLLHVLPASALGSWAAPLSTLPAAVLEHRPELVTVGVTRPLLLPAPVRAPLLAWLGVVACEVLFRSSIVLSRPVAPFALHVPFLAYDLASLVCTVLN